MNLNDGEWHLPQAGPDDERMSQRLMATGGYFSPGKQWNIDCLVRVIAPCLDAQGLLDGPAPWLEARNSRSEAAGGLTVEFAPHPDEPDPEHLKMRHFRFRPQRVTKSNQALADLAKAAARRAFLMRRRAAIDDGRITAAEALICDAVVPCLLAALGIDPQEVATIASEGKHVVRSKTGKTDDAILSMDLQPKGQELLARQIEIPGRITYRGAHGSPKLIVRDMTSNDAEIAAMIGRPLVDVIDRPEFRVEGLEIVAVNCRGDTTTFTLTRPQTTLIPVPE